MCLSLIWKNRDDFLSWSFWQENFLTKDVLSELHCIILQVLQTVWTVNLNSIFHCPHKNNYHMNSNTQFYEDTIHKLLGISLKNIGPKILHALLFARLWI